jgi:hypothetical protein
MTAHIKNLRIEDRVLEPGGMVFPCFIFSFAIATSKGENRDELFQRTHEVLEYMAPRIDRNWDPFSKRWFVKVEYRATLAKLFSNFESALEALKSSPTLF